MALMQPHDDRQQRLAEYQAAIVTRTKQTIQSVIEIGQYLKAAREIVKRGEWSDFLLSVHLSDARAKKLMRLADAFGDVQSLPNLEVGRFEEVMRALESREARLQLIETEDLEGMSPEEFKELLASQKAEEERLKGELKQQRSRADKAESRLREMDQTLVDAPRRVRQANLALRNVDMAIAECIEAVNNLPTGTLTELEPGTARSIRSRIEGLLSLLTPVINS